VRSLGHDSSSMRKAHDFYVLAASGLPVPMFDVFDEGCLEDHGDVGRLRYLARAIKIRGSGLIGVRTEPKSTPSSLHNYPHYMPLRTADEVQRAMKETVQQFPGHWWFLVNEAFTDYCFNAVLRVTNKLMLPGNLRLDGEVNLVDNCPLRPAMANPLHLTPASSWYGCWPARLRSMIIASGLFEILLETSLVRVRNRTRLVFWGMRPNV
jgi:hypothetical protein